jgi:lysine 6-dehydrogenase
MFKYGVLGGGRQGTAAAYDLARFGDAEYISIGDVDFGRAAESAGKVNDLVQKEIAVPSEVDVTNRDSLRRWLAPLDAVLSAVPYYLNLDVALACIDTRTYMADLGGNTEVVQEELGLHQKAAAAGVAIVPDCGLMPGLGNILAVYGIGKAANPKWVHIYVGGLPQNPKPPLNYKLSFNIEGLTNEYAGDAVILRNGSVSTVPSLSELEMVDFPQPLGKCEAFITAGGTSTVPWSLAGQIDEYWEKTVRYPGHRDQIKLFADAGFLSLEPVSVNGVEVVPRKLFHRLIAPLITFDEDPDVVVLRVDVGDENGLRFRMEMLDFYDPKTGFMSMERTTGFPAAMVVEMLAKGEIEPGARPLEKVVPADLYVSRLPARGLKLVETAI